MLTPKEVMEKLNKICADSTKPPQMDREQIPLSDYRADLNKIRLAVNRIFIVKGL